MDSEINSKANLQDILNTLEVDRKKIAETYQISYILFGLAALIIAVSIFIGLGVFAVILGLVPLIVGIVMYFRIDEDVKKYKFTYKQVLLERR
ncbi:hypothetical protein [Flavobacterium ginsenosidimutans]|uniref:hypothetical protein n=1 Tax=Flavobacterium ginsenosidimutans TaxID=687844 RepID=UPI003D990230